MQLSTIKKSAINAQQLAFASLFVMPLFFSTNIIFGRASIEGGHSEPFTLAFLRWFLAALILLPFVWQNLRSKPHLLRQYGYWFFGLSFFGMWVCGAIVYLALKYTSATNGTLIYTTSPVMVLIIEFIFKGRRTSTREVLGITIAFLGITIIVFQGSLEKLFGLTFNIGDLLFVLTALSWAIYSVWLKSEALSPLQTLPLFALIAGAGAVLLLPFALVETVMLQTFPSTSTAWALIGGTVIISSLLAFSLFQNGVRHVGAPTTSIFLYLLPVYGITLAVLFLDETLMPFHLWGMAFVMGGVIIATLPKRKRD